MREIKSVRIRNKMHLNYINLDIKITLYEDGSEMIVDSDNKIMQPQFYKKNGIYSNYTDDRFIKDFIDSNSKLSGATYEIIQDPWTEKVPLWRSYGFDPYYLNNGASILISWTNIDGFVEGGRKYSDDNGNEINEVASNSKIVTIITKDDKPMHFTKNNDIELKSQGDSKQWSGLVTDKNIVSEIIEKWNNKIPGYGLDLCSPDNLSCLVIEYKSPLIPITEEVVKPTNTQINKLPKIKMNVIIPDVIIKVKNDISLKVYIGDDNRNVDNFIYNTDDEDISQYLESSFEGMSEEEFNIQDDVSNGQIDSDSNLGTPGDPANIQPVGSFDALLRLAGQCARELGKNPRVNYQNLRSGYIKGIHGLCPQGTFSILYALTGIKSLGQLRGNANTFSMNGSKGLPSSYFNSKIRIGKDYFNNSNSWQIGDIVAVDYNGRPYGHIQIWTGVKWVSDFTQNTLQRNHVDWNSVALHRMNNSGITATKNQSGAVV